MTRRILQIIGTLDRGAQQKQLLLLAAGLPRDAFNVHVCALAPGPLAADFERQGIRSTVMGNSRRLDVGVFLRLRRHIAELKPDVVHTWGTTANTWGRLAAGAVGARGIVASVCDADSSSSWPRWAVDRWLAGRTNAIIVACSTLTRQRTTQACHKVRVIPPGIGPAEPSDRTRDDVLDELRLPTGARLIAAVGRLAWCNRIKDLIWATDLLKVIRDDAHLLVIGDGPQRETLLRYRRLCHLDDKVHFLGFRHDLPRLLPHFDLLWQAGNRQNLSMAVLEAMASGVPVVAADTPINRALVTPNETGHLVPLGDRAGFARCANTLLNDPTLARRLATGAQQRIANDFTVEAMVEKHAAVYGEGKELGSP